MALGCRPIIETRAERRKPRTGFVRAFAVDAGDEHLSAGSARVEITVECRAEAVELVRLTVVVAQIRARFPAEISTRAERRCIEAPPDRGRGILVVRWRRARLQHRRVRRRDGDVGEIAVDRPGLHAPADAVAFDIARNRQARRLALRRRFRADEPGALQEIVVADARRGRDAVAEIRLAAQRRRAGIVAHMIVGRPAAVRLDGNPAVRVLVLRRWRTVSPVPIRRRPTRRHDRCRGCRQTHRPGRCRRCRRAPSEGSCPSARRSHKAPNPHRGRCRRRRYPRAAARSR